MMNDRLFGFDTSSLNLATPKAAELEAEMERTFAGKHIIVGVDRLDYTKGIPQKLLAFEELLEKNPQWRESAALTEQGARIEFTASLASKTLDPSAPSLCRRSSTRFGSLTGRTPKASPGLYSMLLPSIESSM